MWPNIEGKSESFGEYLKREREYRHISLDELSKATKIRKYYLDAIERDEYKLLPAESYLKGFVRSYAKYIGLDPDDTILRLESYLKQNESKKTPVPIKQGIITRTKGIYTIVAIAGVLIIIALIGIIKKDKRIEVKKEVKKTELLKTTEKPPVLQTEQKSLAPEGQKKEQLHIKLRAKEKTWVMVKRDNEKPFDVILWEGDVVNWYAEERISLRIGNAQGVEIIYNGTPLKNLGSKGEVVGIILPDDFSRFQ